MGCLTPCRVLKTISKAGGSVEQGAYHIQPVATETHEGYRLIDEAGDELLLLTREERAYWMLDGHIRLDGLLNLPSRASKNPIK